MHPLDAYKQRSYAAMGLRPFRGLQGLGLAPAEPILKEEGEEMSISLPPAYEPKEEVAVQPLPLPLPKPPTSSVYIEPPEPTPAPAPPPSVPQATFVPPPEGFPAPVPTPLPTPSVKLLDVLSEPTPSLIPQPPAVEAELVSSKPFPWLWVGGGAAALAFLYMLTRR